MRGHSFGTRRLAFAATHYIQAYTGECKGSQQSESVQVTKDRNSALHRDEHADGDSDGEENREMRCSPQLIALLDKLREELHA